MPSLLQQAVASQYVVLGSVGAHARQAWQIIVNNKNADINGFGYTIWLNNSQAVSPQLIQTFCRSQGARYVIFVARRRNNPGSGTRMRQIARNYSDNNGQTWCFIPNGMSIRGKIDSQRTTGFWFTALQQIGQGSLDLGSFVRFPNGAPIPGFSLRESTFPAQQIAPVRPGRYEILAVAQLSSPFAVSLQA
jgi:hypothetical protein